VHVSRERPHTLVHIKYHEYLLYGNDAYTSCPNPTTDRSIDLEILKEKKIARAENIFSSSSSSAPRWDGLWMRDVVTRAIETGTRVVT